MTLKKEQVFHCILCHSIALGAIMLDWKLKIERSLIKLKMGPQSWKNIFNMSILTIIVFISMKLHSNILQE